MSPLLLAGIVAGLALVLTAVFTPAVRGAAIAGGMVRQVQADRWHSRPTPAIGGVAIYAGFGVALGVAYLLDPNTTQGFVGPSTHAVLPIGTWEGLILGSSVAFVVGLIDDFRRLRPLTKLAGQIVAASVLLLSGVGVWLTGVYAVDAALSLLWFVGVTNALNLLDNMDGLAAGVAAIAGAYLTCLFLLEGSSSLAILSLGFVAATVGFLAHNYPPARIFMGDSGSLFLGLFLAGLALAPGVGLSRSLAAVVAAPALILGVPILDTTLVTVGRVLEGRPVSQGGRDHTSHRFVALGLPERHTLWLLWGMAGAGGAVGVLLRSAARGTALLLGGALVCALVLVGAYLLAVRFRALDHDEAEGLSLYRFVVRSQERYPVLALLLDAVWIVLAYYAAYLIRWDPAELGRELPYFQQTVLIWVGAKVVAFVLSGAYSTPWRSYGLYDALRIQRANLMGAFLAAATLFVIQPSGLSRGVVAIDFLVCSLLTVGARFSFRLLEGTARRYREDSIRVVVLADVDDAELVIRQLARIPAPMLRVAAVAAPLSQVARATLAGRPLFGGHAALRRAIAETGAQAVVLADRPSMQSKARNALEQYLDVEGGLDVYELSVSVHRLVAPAALVDPPPVP